MEVTFQALKAIRDLLFSLAENGLYKPKWSAEIQEEWSLNLLLNRSDLKKEQLQLTVESMNLAFPDSNVDKYSSLISSITLPDPYDRHFVAAAILSKALKPKEILWQKVFKLWQTISLCQLEN